MVTLWAVPVDREAFVQDFTRAWFPKHGKGENMKLWPKQEKGQILV